MRMFDNLSGGALSVADGRQAGTASFGFSTVIWVAFDVVRECLDCNLSPRFIKGKRFYRLKLRGKCGIFDLRTGCFLSTTDAIFLPQFEIEYRRAGSRLDAIEAFVRKHRLGA